MSKPSHPSDAAYAAAAWVLECDVAAIMAVAEVEAGPAGAWLPSGEPAILYEPHIFSRLTRGRFDKAHPSVSYPTWKPGTYGKSSEQHAKLQAAAALDREAALQACSWGLFQILGTNHQRAGYPTMQAMVTAAYRSVDDHLRMFVRFILGSSVLAAALRTHSWETFARIYNGPSFARNRYAEKMEAAHRRLSAT